MKKNTFNSGQSLVEILFAIAVFTIGVVTIGYLIFDSFTSLRYSIESTQARLFAAEGLEAVRALRDSSFDAIPAGTYGLELTDGAWSLVSLPDSQGQFERTIVITDIDPELKEILSIVTWGENPKTLELATHLSNWQQTGGMLTDLSIDINNAALSASSTQLGGIAFRNTGDQSVVVTDMIVQWNGAAVLESIALNTVEVFTSSTSASAESGTLIDIDDYDIAAATGFHLADFVFDQTVEATDFVVTAVLSDQTKKHVLISL